MTRLASRVHQYLLAQLAARRFPQGAHLNAQRIADELNVSRTTVNAAIARLIEEGWARRDGNRRPSVAALPKARGDGGPVVFNAVSEADTVYHALLEKLVRGDVEAGGVIRIHRLAEELNAGLPAVRHALKEAASAGLIERQPRRGWQVIRLNAAEVWDIYRLRLYLEPLMLRQAVRRISDATLDELTAEADAMNLSESASRYEIRRADYNFHHTLAEASGRRVLAEVLDPLVHKLFLRPSSRTARVTFEEHKDILEAIRMRDAELATTRLKAHLRKGRESYMAAARRLPRPA